MKNIDMDILEQDYKYLVITEETREQIKKNIEKYPRFYVGAPVRIIMGKIYTDEEYEKRRDEVLSRELPGGEPEKVKESILRKILGRKRK